MLVPLFTGGIVGLLHTGTVFPLLALMVAALALFWPRTPTENWLGTGMMRAQTAPDRRAVATATFTLLTIAMLALMALFRDGRNRDLLFLGAIAAIASLPQAILRKQSRKTRVLSQVVVDALGLTLTAPAAYYVVTGELNRTAWILWIAIFLIAVNQIHFVQLRIHSARLSGWSQKFAHGRSLLYKELPPISRSWVSGS